MGIIKKPIKSVLSAILFGVLAAGLVNAQTVGEKKLAIKEFVARADATFKTSKKVFTVKEKRNKRKFLIEESNYSIKKGEFLNREFSYSMNEKNVEVFVVRYEIEKFSAEETYYFKNKKLVYATEQHFFETNGEKNAVWSGVFYFENEKLLDHGTNGHGKSETEEWNAEKQVLQMSRERLDQLNKYLARKK